MSMQDDDLNNADLKSSPGQAPNELSDKLGDLEVQRVDASDELDRIRSQSASKVQDQTNITDEADSENAFSDESSGLMDILREANLSPRHLRFCCGGIIVVALLIGFVFGGMKFVDWLGNKPDQPDKPVVIEDDEEAVIEPEDEGTFVEIDDEIKYTDSTVYAGLLLGNELTEKDPAVDAGEILGEELVSQDSLATAITTFAELFNALQVDVNVLLDQSRERQETLDDYVGELKYFAYRGENELNQLKTLTDNLSRQFEEIESEKDLFEQRFFDNLSDLDAYGGIAAPNRVFIT